MCNLLCLFVKSTDDITRNFSGKAGRQTDQTLMILFECLKIHPWTVIIPFRKTDGNNLHKIRIALVIFCKENQMIVSILPMAGFPVKTGIGSHIDLTTNYRIDACSLGRLIKIHHAIHHTVIRNRCTVHPQFFDPGYIFFYFVGTI